MTLVTIDESWPESLPLPLIEATGKPDHSVVTSPTSAAVLQRRLRFSGTPIQLSVNWAFTMTQFIAFKSFFRTDLDNGTSLFKIELRYPQQSIVKEWVARFLGGFSAQPEDGKWIISAELALVLASEIDDAAAEEEFHAFLVTPPGTPFHTSEGYVFYVQ